MSKTRADFFKDYLSCRSVANALWRSFECEKFSEERIIDPVLDAGCGDGFFVHTTFRKTLEAGVDLSEGELKLAEKSGCYLKTHRADILKMPFRKNAFKTVISNCVLEHVVDIDSALGEISRVLKPGGRLLITVPSEYFNTCSIFQNWLEGLGLRYLSRKYIESLNRVFKHHHIDSALTWERRMKKAGLRLEKKEYFVSIPAYHAYELWLITSLPSKIWKVLFGRWTLLPRFWIKWIIPELMNGVLWAETKKGAAYFIAARKI